MKRYYAIRISHLTAYSSQDEARKASEALNLSTGEESGILELVGVSRRSMTTTWLDKPDAAADLMRASTGWSWPTLPPGHSYLNPENLTVEQLGDGWRPLCTLDERYPEDHQLSLTTGWAPAVPGILSKPNGRSITYRTRAPIPTLPYNP